MEKTSQRNEKMKKRKDKPIAKNWKFYRRTGAIWTDKYHTTEQMLKFVERPDLDKKYEDYLAKQKREEERLERQRLLDKRRDIKKIRSRLHVRQLENGLKGMNEPGKFQPNMDESRKQELFNKAMALREEANNEHALKDRFYYRRTGNLWEDLKIVPPNRLGLVANEKLITKDIWAATQIQKKFQKETEEEERLEEEKRQRVAEIREEFHRQQRRNQKKWERIGLYTGERPQSAKPAASCNKAASMKSRPVSSTSANRPSSGRLCMHHRTKTPTTDYVGLLHHDDAVRPRLEKLRQERPNSAISKASSFSVSSAATSAMMNEGLKWPLHSSFRSQGALVPNGRPSSSSSPRSKSMKVSSSIYTTVETSPSLLGEAILAQSELGGGDEAIYDQLGEDLMGPIEESRVEAVPSLCAPSTVLRELDDFDERLQLLRDQGETMRPFYLHEKAT